MPLLRHRLALPLLAGLLLPAGMSAQSTEAELGGFRTPTGNISCQAFAVGRQKVTELRCDILESTAPVVRRPADCELDYGHAFVVRSRGRAFLLCAGDTVADPDLPRLAYGAAWTAPGVRCTLTIQLLRCTNRAGRGFQLAKARQRLL
jgi:hypothetical protein